MDGDGRHERIEDDSGDEDRGRNRETDGVHAGRGHARPQGDLDPVKADRQCERDARQRHAPPDACRLPRLGERRTALPTRQGRRQVNDRLGTLGLDLDM